MNGNPLIFLDIDGVLNSQSFYRMQRIWRLQNPNLTHHNIDRDAVSLLNNLIAETGAFVVISSTWRLGKTIEELQGALEAYGFKGRILDKTPSLDGDYIVRGNEIFDWMRNHPVELGCEYWNYTRYVILDDDSDMLYWQKDNFICVDGFSGITPKTVFKAKKILGKKLQVYETSELNRHPGQ